MARMSPLARKLALLAPLLYAGLIAGFFALEFEGARRIEDARGAVSLSGYVLPGNPYRERRIHRLRIRGSAFTLNLFHGRGVVARMESGRRSPLAPREIAPVDGGFRVYFEHDVVVEVLNEPGDVETVQIATVVPETLGGVLSLELPFAPAPDTEIVRGVNSPVLDLDAPHGLYRVSVPGGGAYDSTNRRMILPGDPGTYTLRYTMEEDPNGGTLASWFRPGEDRPTDSGTDLRVAEYLETAWEQWRHHRYSAESGVWTYPDGGERFDERIVLALLAEAWERDEYSRVRAEMRNARGIHRRLTSFRLAPFLGELDYYAADMRAESADRAARIEELVAGGDPDVLTEDDPWSRRTVFEVAGHHGGAQLSERLVDFVSGLDLSELPYEALISLYEARYVFPAEGVALPDRLDELAGRVEELLIERVRNTESGFFVRTGEEHSNLLLSVRTGLLLREIDHEDERVDMLGRRLVKDALDLADAGGFLPRYLQIDGSSIVGWSGTVTPEELYPWLSDNPRLPTAIAPGEPFADDGVIWTVADLSDVRIDESSISMTVAGPPERTHYLLIYGLPSLSRAQMLGLSDWRDDPNFEAYIRGRHYNAEASTLKIKYTNEASHGEIALYF